MDTVVLASASPRRRELLERVRIPCTVVIPEVDEAPGDEAPVDLVKALARRKVEAVLARLPAESTPRVLGADTVVEVDGAVLGKPGTAGEAEQMLRLLSGRTHRVHTGLALFSDRARPIEIESVTTDVRFRALEEQEVRSYLATGEWRGAAGAYRIQERGAFLVAEIHGSWSNVVGLPLEAFYGMLRRSGYRF